MRSGAACVFLARVHHCAAEVTFGAFVGDPVHQVWSRSHSTARACDGKRRGREGLFAGLRRINDYRRAELCAQRIDEASQFADFCRLEQCQIKRWRSMVQPQVEEFPESRACVRECFVGIPGNGELESGKCVHVGGATPVAFVLGVHCKRRVLDGGSGVIPCECDVGGVA